MANKVWYVQKNIVLDLSLDDLGHPNGASLWDKLYQRDRRLAADRVPVAERGMCCAGVCRDEGVVAWMHLRVRQGRREAVHERAEDEARHSRPMSDEHKAYQERIVRTAEGAGFRAASEVRTRTGARTSIRTDTLVEGEGGHRIGWEIQLSTAAVQGPRSVRSRASRAMQHGITPAWHTDRAEYARRQDTQWTRSNNLPAYAIAKIGDLRVVSGFRALEFWTCDLRARYPCPKPGYSRCGGRHVTPQARDVFFDDLVRKTAAGLIVPLEYQETTRPQRFWVPVTDRDRYFDAIGVFETSSRMEANPEAGTGSKDDPTCRPRSRIVVAQPAGATLDWRDSFHWREIPSACSYCHRPANLVDETGRPMHKVCHEQALQDMR